jgi:hypothetical protein
LRQVPQDCLLRYHKKIIVYPNRNLTTHSYSVSDVATLNLYAEMGRCVSLEVDTDYWADGRGHRTMKTKGKMAAPKAFVRVNPFEK